MIRGLLVRVAADQGEGGGRWNGPADSGTREFVYVAIPDSEAMRAKMSKPYSGLRPALTALGTSLPSHLAKQNMHLDPDFDHLTYGDGNERAKQIRSKLKSGDLLVFYAGLKDVCPSPRLLYAIIGLYVVDEIVPVTSVTRSRWHENAHTRRADPGVGDIVVRAKPGVSGRLNLCLPIGSYRAPSGQPHRQQSYRVEPRLLATWGGLDITDGWLQRSGRLPEFLDAGKFYRWFRKQSLQLISRNN